MGKHADNGGYIGVWPYHVGVIAPFGFAPPGLDDAVGRTLWGLLARKRRQGPVTLATLQGVPVSRAALAAGDRYVWPVGHHGDGGYRLAHLRACVGVAASVDALVLFHGPDPPPEMGWVLAVARRLGTATRSVRVTEPAADRVTGRGQDR